MFKNKRLIKRFIGIEKIQKMYSRYHGVYSYSNGRGMYCEAEYNLEMYNKYETQIGEIIKILYPKMNRRFRYSCKLAHIKVIGKIYLIYSKIFNGTWKRGGPVTIIGRPDKNKNCEYPNMPYYRITKAWKSI